MKFLTLLILIASYGTFASDGKSAQSLIDSRIKEIQNKEVITTEDRFWTSVIEAYDFLKTVNLNERYFFMYEAMRSQTMKEKARETYLTQWIAKEDSKIQERLISSELKAKWSKLVKRIQYGIKFKSEATNLVQELKFLNDLRSEVHSLQNSSKMFVTPVKSRPVEVVARTQNNSSRELGILALIFVATWGAFFIGRLRKPSEKTQKIQEFNSFEETLPPLPFEEVTVQPTNVQTVNLEDEWRTLLDESSHLFENAEVTIANVQKTPFKTSVRVSSEKLKEALEFFLKGTISMINSSPTKATNLNWNCVETGGRVYLEFTINEIECNEKSLYYNALMDGNTSAPSHFGRAEQILEDYLPAVSISSQAKRTRVSLGLEATQNTMSYS